MPAPGEIANLEYDSGNQAQRVSIVAGTASVVPPVGQALAAASSPVVIASDQSAVPVTLATKLAGEDLVNDVLKTEHRYTSFRVTADTQIKAAPGFIHAINVNPTTATPTAGLLTIYDSLTETGTILHSEWVFSTSLTHTIILDVAFSTGLYVGFDATLANVSVDGSYR